MAGKFKPGDIVSIKNQMAKVVKQVMFGRPAYRVRRIRRDGLNPQTEYVCEGSMMTLVKKVDEDLGH